jgi:hypothetical protein
MGKMGIVCKLFLVETTLMRGRRRRDKNIQDVSMNIAVL